jgi:hypothetical protein
VGDGLVAVSAAPGEQRRSERDDGYLRAPWHARGSLWKSF